MQFLHRHAISTLEPSLKASDVLYSPSTGILNSRDFMQSLVNDIESGGIVYKTPFHQAKITSQCLDIHLGGIEPAIVNSKYLINPAGLNAVSVAKHIEGIANNLIPQIYFAKVYYFTYMGQVPFKRLIYTAPETGGLGLHLTLDMGG